MNVDRLRAALGHGVSRNAAALGSVQIANYLVPLLLLPFFARQLGMQAFGTVAMVLAAIQVALVVTDYGFSLSATLDISLNRDDRAYVNRKIGAVFGAKALLVGVVGSAFLIAPYLYEPLHDYRTFLAAAILAVLAQAFQPIWLFQGLERMKPVALYMVATKILYAVLVLALVSSPADGLRVIHCWGLAQAAGLALGLYLLHAQGHRIAMPSLRAVGEELGRGAGFFTSRIAVSLYTSANSLFLGTQGAAGVALFSVCEQLYKAGQSVTVPLNGALLPYMARHRDWRFFFKALGVSLAGLALGCLVLALCAEPLLVGVFGEEYRAGVPVLLVFLCTVLVNYLAVAFGYSAYAALGKVQVANATVIVGGLAHLLFLAGLYGFHALTPLSVALATLLTETLVMVARVLGVYLLRKRMREGEPHGVA
ncbi:oligosaccharide flippase family protein [Pseudomonas sp. RIT-PI-AD]|uniref:oligosaccharide flippase family protein n=1 Tax=Pseudomonas sp. RIT-PI-AD TaxID=3035294 RepID=UPI0021D7EB39|nr:oligosaccharide flippase family protein [Pseudomonas sp. RIT-PI-AD]